MIKTILQEIIKAILKEAGLGQTLRGVLKSLLTKPDSAPVSNVVLDAESGLEIPAESKPESAPETAPDSGGGGTKGTLQTIAFYMFLPIIQGVLGHFLTGTFLWLVLFALLFLFLANAAWYLWSIFKMITFLGKGALKAIFKGGTPAKEWEEKEKKMAHSIRKTGYFLFLFPPFLLFLLLLLYHLQTGRDYSGLSMLYAGYLLWGLLGVFLIKRDIIAPVGPEYIP